MTPAPSVSDSLRQHGLKPTAPRLHVLQMLHSAKNLHWDAQTIYLQLVRRGTPLGLTTVYKVLSQLTQVGLVMQHELQPGKRSFELAQHTDGEHGHLVCLHTGEIWEFDTSSIQVLLTEIAQAHGLSLSRCVVTAYGTLSIENQKTKPE